MSDLVAYCVPLNIPALGYDFLANGVVVQTIRVDGKIISRKMFYPPKKVRRRIGRQIRRAK